MPPPHTERFVNKEERTVLSFVLAVSESLVGSWAHMNRAFFLVGNFCVLVTVVEELPVLFCPFPEVHVYVGTLPTPACPLWCFHLHFSANQCSLTQDGAGPGHVELPGLLSAPTGGVPGAVLVGCMPGCVCPGRFGGSFSLNVYCNTELWSCIQ